MFRPVHRLIVLLILAAASATACASHRPAAVELLPLVPPDAQVVSAIADPGHGSSTGRLLAATADNNRDLAVFLALTGSNGSGVNMPIRALIAVASSAPDVLYHENLNQHLLLVDGRLSAPRIRHAALTRDAQSVTYHGLPLFALPALILPGGRLSEVRWLAILNDHIALIGTPTLVSAAIDRWQHGQPSDPVLLARLADLPSDVNTWSLISLAPTVLAARLPFLAGFSPFAPVLRDAAAVALGIRYGATDRIDFTVEESSNPRQIPAPDVRRSIAAAFTIDANTLANPQATGRPHRIHGSVTVPAQQLDAWLAAWAPSQP